MTIQLWLSLLVVIAMIVIELFIRLKRIERKLNSIEEKLREK